MRFFFLIDRISLSFRLGKTGEVEREIQQNLIMQWIKVMCEKEASRVMLISSLYTENCNNTRHLNKTGSF